jgi:hypothetical protein
MFGGKQCNNPNVSKADLKASFSCNMDLADANRSPVLLVPGTTLRPAENFDWNYIPALSARGWPVCSVQVPEESLGDIQVATLVPALLPGYPEQGRRHDFALGIPPWCNRR